MAFLRLPTQRRPWLWLGGGALGLALAVLLARGLAHRAPPPVAPALPIRTVTALGRLEPIGEVRTIAAPMASAGQATLLRLLVDRGIR